MHDLCLNCGFKNIKRNLVFSSSEFVLTSSISLKLCLTAVPMQTTVCNELYGLWIERINSATSAVMQNYINSYIILFNLFCMFRDHCIVFLYLIIRSISLYLTSSVTIINKKKRFAQTMESGFSLAEREEEKDNKNEKSAGMMMKKVSYMAAPMVAVYLSQYLLQVISMIMAGHLDELSLSSVAIATSLTNVTGFSLLVRYISLRNVYSPQNLRSGLAWLRSLGRIFRCFRDIVWSSFWSRAI